MVDREGPSKGTGTDDTHIRTFLIADVRGYTLFTQERGDEAAGKLAAKFARIARDAVEGRGGTLLELRGDEALCVFASTRQAIRAAADLQERFVEETLADPELPLMVGVGLDAGEAVEVEGGYRGGALNLAARLCGEARAGEILASREVAHLARRVEGVRYEDRGSLALKGLTEPVSLVRVVPEGVDAVARLTPYAPVRPPKTEARRRPPWPALAAAALAVVLIALGLPLLLNGGDSTEPVANSMSRIDPTGGTLDLATELNARPGAVATGFGSIWVVHPDRGLLSRLSVDDGKVIDTIPVGNAPTGVATGEGSVWVTNAADGTVSRISPETNQQTQLLEVGSGPSGIAVGAGALWIADRVASQLVRVNLASADTRPVDLPAGPTAVRFTPSGVWVTSATAASVTRVDPDSLEVTLQVPVGNGPTAVLSAFGSIWVANHLDGTVSQIEPATGRVRALVPVGQGPNALAVAAGRVWVSNEFASTVVSLDPSIDPVGIEEPIDVGGEVGSLATTPEGVWVSVGPSATSHRGGTIRFANAERPFTLDPGLSYEPTGWQVLALTNDGLLSFRKTGGPQGATLVPDLAAALPQVSANGLTYRFPLLSGIRYSTGEPVRPEDFRFGLERAFRLSVDAAGLFGALAGARGCSEKPSTCDLTEEIVTEADAVTFHLASPDPDFPYLLALPFASPLPSGTPIEDQGFDPVPGTGPYLVIDADEQRIVMERNPAFEEWSPAAQPDGFVDRIEWTFPTDLDASLESVLRGDTDALSGYLPPESIAELRTAYPDQLVQVAEPLLFFLGMNGEAPPFSDDRVRRAVNLAVDRARVQELLGGDGAMRVTCQILPPNFPGYEPYCPYTADTGGRAVDLEQARLLVREANAEGSSVAMWAPDPPFLPGGLEVARYFEGLLDRIGLDARLRIVKGIDPYFKRTYRGGDEIQIFESVWFADYPAPGGFIGPLFRCESPANAWGFCDRGFDRAIVETHSQAVTDPAAANAEWAELDRQLVDEAIVVPLTNSVRSYAFSDRVGNAQIHPQWGVLLSRLWVR